MPPKKDKKGKGKEKKVSVAPDTTEYATIAKAIRDQIRAIYIETVKQKFSVSALRTENMQLEEETKATRRHCVEYQEMFKKRQEEFQLKMEETKRNGSQKIDQIHEDTRNAKLQIDNEAQDLVWTLTEKLAEKQIFQKKVVEWETYREMETTQAHLIEALQAELESTKFNIDKELRHLKNAFAKEYRAVGTIIKDDTGAYQGTCNRTAKSSREERSRKIIETNHRLERLLLTMVRKNKAMMARKEKLTKFTASLDREEQYLSDMMCIHDNRAFEKTGTEVSTGLRKLETVSTGKKMGSERNTSEERDTAYDESKNMVMSVRKIILESQKAVMKQEMESKQKKKKHDKTSRPSHAAAVRNTTFDERSIKKVDFPADMRKAKMVTG